MALNGSYKTGSSSDHYFTISWEVVKQSVTDNTSTLKWTATCENNKQANYDTLTFDVSSLRIYTNGKGTTHTLSVSSVTSTNKTITLDLGTITIPHASTTETQYFQLSDISYLVRFTSSTSSGSISSSKTALDNNYKGYYIDPVVPAVKVLTAPDFNDEENPTISYQKSYNLQTGTKVYAAISFTGGTDDVPYREISASNTSYTFNLTDAERKILRQGITTGSVKTVRFYIKTTFADGESTWHYLTKNLSLINHEPLLYPTVKDISPETLALTGDENVFVKYASMAEYSTGAVARKEAEIVSQSIQCGSKTVTDLYNGVIDDVESGTFIFNATDNRGIRAETIVLEKTLIDYLKPTCYQELEIGLAGETGATINLKVKGNYFNGTFGAIPNTIKLEVRYGEANGTMGAWQTLTGTPTFNGNTYELNATFTGFSYAKAYTFQSRITDKILYAQSSQYTIRMLPVFDWSETDFNFNVPVKMHNETVLRHNEEANNTVLSASGGHIYIRPGGSESTSGELMIKPDGDVLFGGEVEVNSAATFNGDINLNGTVLIDGVDLNELLQPEEPEEDTPTAADYIVETGTEAMGTNGTWYWTKWASGRAECYGTRNFGKMSVGTSTGNVYRGEAQSQDLPAGLFIEAPDFISINMRPGAIRAWIVAANSDPSTTSTGAFNVLCPANTSLSASYICFDIKGRWQ